MTHTDPTEPQLYVLRAISRGEVTQNPTDQTAPWRLSAKPQYAHFGRPVTRTAEALFRRGLARPSVTLDEHGRRPAVVTADGYEQLSKGAHRAKA